MNLVSAYQVFRFIGALTCDLAISWISVRILIIIRNCELFDGIPTTPRQHLSRRLPGPRFPDIFILTNSLLLHAASC